MLTEASEHLESDKPDITSVISAFMHRRGFKSSPNKDSTVDQRNGVATDVDSGPKNAPSNLMGNCHYGRVTCRRKVGIKSLKGFNVASLFSDTRLSHITLPVACCMIAELNAIGLTKTAELLHSSFRDVSFPDVDDQFKGLVSSATSEITFAVISGLGIPKLFADQEVCDILFAGVTGQGWRHVLDRAVEKCVIVGPSVKPSTSKHAQLESLGDPCDVATKAINTQSSGPDAYHVRSVKISKYPSRIQCGRFARTFRNAVFGCQHGPIIVVNIDTRREAGVSQQLRPPSNSLEFALELSMRSVVPPDVVKLGGHGSSVMCVDLVDDNYVLSGALDGSVKLHLMETIAPLVSYHGHQFAVWDIALADSTRFASASLDGCVRVFDFSDTFPLRHLAGHTDSCDAVAFSREGDGCSILASAGSDSVVKIWDIRAPVCVSTFSIPGHGSPDSLVILADSVTCSSGGRLLSYNRKNSKLTSVEHGHMNRVTKIRTSPTDVSIFATAGLDGNVKIWKLPLVENAQCDFSFYSAGLSILDACVVDSDVRILCF